MRYPITWAAVVLCLLVSACARNGASVKDVPAPAAAPPNPYSTFAEAVSAIADGDVDQILALKNQPADTQMGEFLRTLYARYGSVRRLHAVAFEKEKQVARGVFLAQHESGPFLWDMIAADGTYTMLRGTNDFTGYLIPAKPEPAAMQLAAQSMEQLNQGDAEAVFSNLVCNCISSDAFGRQVNDLAERAGTEVSREFIRAESLPGLENQLLLLHFLSQREEIHLGFHFTLWKIDNQWRINAVNWTQEELLPQPLKSVSRR